MRAKNIVIVGHFMFPFGSAGASRIRNISKGLMLQGASVQVITQCRGQEWSGSDAPLLFEGIPYYSTYHGNQAVRLPIVKRMRNRHRSISESAYLLRKLVASHQVDAVILYAHCFDSALPILKACKEFDIPIIADIVEWLTLGSFQSGLLNPQFWQVLMKRRLLDPSFCGASVISKYLYEKYQRLGYPLLRMPALCDFDAMQGTLTRQCSRTTPLTLVFVGGNKPNDGLDDVIEALRIGNFQDFVKLNVIGNSPADAHIVRLQKRVDRDSKIRSSVTFVGRLTTSDYQSTLLQADALLLTRRDNTMARAAFPSRLPEFLATGKPVITTSIPDVPEYLSDNEHAFLVNPGRPDLLAEKIAFILRNRELAAAIGYNGQEQARRLFDYRIHTGRLSRFIDTLQ